MAIKETRRFQKAYQADTREPGLINRMQSPKLSVFVAHSFSKDDEVVVNTFLKHLNTFRKLGFDWEDAEEPESSSVADKVIEKLENKQVFIGVFTRKYPLSGWFSKRLNPHDRSWYWSFLFRKTDAWAASGWTLQESGFAIAKQMKLILLVENGVIDIGGLHGDHEIIPFFRQNPEGCFAKLDAQLVGLLSEVVKPETVSDARRAPSAPGGEGVAESLEKAEKQRPERRHIVDIYRKLLEKDLKGAREIFDEWLAQSESDEQRVFRQTIYLNFQLETGYSDAFKELELLTVQHPTYSYLQASIGRHLRNLGQLRDATARLTQAAQHEGTSETRAKYLGEAAYCLAKEKDFDSAVGLLENELTLGGVEPTATFRLYEGLAQIAELRKDDDVQVALLEKALSIRPAEHEIRFKLAYKYADMGKDGLALYHYRILANEAPNGTNLNNLGVAYSELGLPGKAAQAYKNSGNLDETLAMANLAKKLIEGGFLDEAQTYVEKGLSIKDFHKNVASAHARIASVRQEEDKKEEEILESIRDEQKFRLEFGQALQAAPVEVAKFVGKWKTPHGELHLNVANGIVTGTGRVEESEGPFTSALYAFTSSKPTITVKILRLEARVKGAAGWGQITIKREGATLLSSQVETVRVSFLIQSESQMRVLETDEKGKTSFVVFERIR